MTPRYHQLSTWPSQPSQGWGHIPPPCFPDIVTYKCLILPDNGENLTAHWLTDWVQWNPVFTISMSRNAFLTSSWWHAYGSMLMSFHWSLTRIHHMSVTGTRSWLLCLVTVTRSLFYLMLETKAWRSRGVFNWPCRPVKPTSCAFQWLQLLPNSSKLCHGIIKR